MNRPPRIGSCAHISDPVRGCSGVTPPQAWPGYSLFDNLLMRSGVVRISRTLRRPADTGEHPEDPDRKRTGQPERLGDVGAFTARGQLIVPVVDGLIPGTQDGEAELPAGFASGDPANRPVHRPDLVATDVPTELGAQRGAGGAVEPLGLEHLGENRPVLRTSAIRFQIFSAGASIWTVTEPSITTILGAAATAGRRDAAVDVGFVGVRSRCRATPSVGTYSPSDDQIRSAHGDLRCPVGVASYRWGIRSVDRDIRVRPAVAWGLLVDLAQWPRWGPSVRRAALDDGGRVLSAGRRERSGQPWVFRCGSVSPNSIPGGGGPGRWRGAGHRT